MVKNFLLEIFFDMKNKNLNSYSKHFLFFLGLFFCLIFFLNYLVDPLWYFNGNKIKKTNYVFNERLSKFNLFYYGKKNEDIDCLIFGSSISTTINQEKFKKNNCFNFSFSAGSVEEYEAYLNYLKYLGYIPKKIYIELPIIVSKNREKKFKDIIKNFSSSEIIAYFPPIVTKNLIREILDYEDKLKNDLKNNMSKIPEFIIEKQSPELFWSHYFSFNSFKFSVKSLLRISNYTNAYDDEFIGFVRKNKSNFNKSFKLKRQINEKDLNYIIANRLNTLKYFDNVYDFSVPNSKINNSKNTYDGSHYYENFISLIADSMEGSELSYGLKINNFDYEDKYKEMFFKYYEKIKG